MLSNAIVQAIRKAENYPHIIRVGVFGSCARDEETKTSDVDILIEYDNSTDDFLDDLDGFMKDMEQLVDVKIDYITMAGLLKSRNVAFRSEVLRDVKWIYNSKHEDNAHAERK
jgi:predicted nucleotidyltransferase